MHRSQGYYLASCSAQKSPYNKELCSPKCQSNVTRFGNSVLKGFCMACSLPSSPQPIWPSGSWGGREGPWQLSGVLILVGKAVRSPSIWVPSDRGNEKDILPEEEMLGGSIPCTTAPPPAPAKKNQGLSKLLAITIII